MQSLYDAAARCLAETDPERKVALTRETADAWSREYLVLEADAPPRPIGEPGLPPRLRLVAPRELPRRKLTSPEGKAALIHAIAHIEFNAINLAWDAVYRFRGLPTAFYTDWVRVAAEEAEHFSLLRAYLNELGWEYGDFPAHQGLWEMAQRTADDPLLRMALVPRVLEARGLDVTPGLMERFEAVGDARAVAILKVILREEVGHVAAGSRWFRYVCCQRALDPDATYRDLLARHLKGKVKGPINRRARLRAGFDEDELDYLEAAAGGD